MKLYRWSVLYALSTRSNLKQNKVEDITTIYVHTLGIHLVSVFSDMDF